MDARVSASYVSWSAQERMVVVRSVSGCGAGDGLRLVQHSEFRFSSRSDPAVTMLPMFATHCLGANDIEDRSSGNADRL